MKIAILGKPFEDHIVPFIQELFNELTQRGAELLVVEHFQLYLKNTINLPAGSQTFNRGDKLEGVDMVLSIGGDGTLLDTVTYVGAQEVPILGINTGRLGFLATVPYDNIINALDALYKGEYAYDDRSLIRVESNQEVFDNLNFGLNEFSLLKRDSSAMIVVHTYIDGDYLNSYWADGLVVATPTGSTGYSLSCGGPLVLPQTNNFIISPVCPHNLNVRPMIVPDKSVISFEVEGRSSSYLATLDSRSTPIDMNVRLSVKREDFVARLIKLDNVNFLSTLRSKLNWGLDKRNISLK
ncbi:NAD kinase [Pontibacter silvestris]|uniref:NAD kinase n=1 Tax=Pontibacter silvestris TaxID=2305183 RepID=A0ABW4WUY1_9BACT|nr:NAD kinase [Pontibacter silvestris]MCC9136397.1 NAD kinase [Pontibacter silvestris]